MGDVALAIALGAGVLYAFFRSVEFQWPSSYFTVSSRLGTAITATPYRYVFFRFVPVFATCTFVAVTLARLGQSPVAGVAGVVVIHAALTSGRAFFVLTRQTKSARTGPLIVLHAAVLIGLAAAGAMAILLRTQLSGLIPEVSDLVTGLWTAVLAGVLGAFVIESSKTRTADPQTQLRKSRDRIPRFLWEHAKVAAEQYGTDPNLLRAFMIVENVQRPSWFRTLERMKGRFFKHGTYGIMQVEADRPLTDQESIDACASGRLRGAVVPEGAPTAAGSPPGFDYQALHLLAATYNPSPGYADDVASAFYMLAYETPGRAA